MANNRKAAPVPDLFSGDEQVIVNYLICFVFFTKKAIKDIEKNEK